MALAETRRCRRAEDTRIRSGAVDLRRVYAVRGVGAKRDRAADVQDRCAHRRAPRSVVGVGTL